MNIPLYIHRAARRILPLLLIAPAATEPLIAATIPESIKSSTRRRVDFHYTPGIVIGMVDRDGRD
ncbi:MAG: hypothetical protein M2R45_04554 [Verrucomicrobia subdivision 3 bacterium]|nr:hypothetical protein [Limisphaerales bacterium]MCS1416807.1 hypothetical protein [Limisphaerales bacterium]